MSEKIKIIRIWKLRLVYAKLYDDNGNIKLDEDICFGTEKYTYVCKRMFWRFYTYRSLDS